MRAGISSPRPLAANSSGSELCFVQKAAALDVREVVAAAWERTKSPELVQACNPLSMCCRKCGSSERRKHRRRGQRRRQPGRRCSALPTCAPTAPSCRCDTQPVVTHGCGSVMKAAAPGSPACCAHCPWHIRHC